MTVVPQRSRTQRAQLVTLVFSVALAVALGGIIYLSVTSIPYLAVSPSTDPAFGKLNACLLAVPERIGFAVNRDGTRAAAWSTSKLVVCDGSTASEHAMKGATLGAFDGTNTLWVSESSRLLRLEGETFVERGPFAAAALVGTEKGVIALDPQGQLVAVQGDGSVTATRALPGQARMVQLAANTEGTFVALFGGGRFSIVNAKTLESTPAEAACPVSWVWWRPASPLLLVECVDISLEINAFDSRSTLLEPRRRIRSTLNGMTYVQSCDVLPCSATPPP